MLFCGHHFQGQPLLSEQRPGDTDPSGQYSPMRNERPVREGSALKNGRHSCPSERRVNAVWRAQNPYGWLSIIGMAVASHHPGTRQGIWELRRGWAPPEDGGGEAPRGKAVIWA